MVGEDVSELLDMIAAQIKVIEVARVKKSCRRCEAMVQEPAPNAAAFGDSQPRLRAALRQRLRARPLYPPRGALSHNLTLEGIPDDSNFGRNVVVVAQ